MQVDRVASNYYKDLKFAFSLSPLYLISGIVSFTITRYIDVYVSLIYSYKFSCLNLKFFIVIRFEWNKMTILIVANIKIMIQIFSWIFRLVYETSNRTFVKRELILRRYVGTSSYIIEIRKIIWLGFICIFGGIFFNIFIF